MLGIFQQSNLRIEVEASEQTIRHSLVCSNQFQQWLWTQRFSDGIPEQLYGGVKFISWIGPVSIQHCVEAVELTHLCFSMSQGIDGFHRWHWGDGWVQSSLEGFSLLPLNLGQTFSLISLRQFLIDQQKM